MSDDIAFVAVQVPRGLATLSAHMGPPLWIRTMVGAPGEGLTGGMLARARWPFSPAARRLRLAQYCLAVVNRGKRMHCKLRCPKGLLQTALRCTCPACASAA